MENYILKENETVLFRDEAILLQDGKNSKNDTRCDVLLTNLNIVIVTQSKKAFRTINKVDVYSVTDVKIYDETIQIIRRQNLVDIYLKSCEIFIEFSKEKNAKEFCDKALKLISGFSKLVRSVKKTQKAIKETNEALGIDVGNMAKGAAGIVLDVTVGVGSMSGAKKGTKVAGKIAEVILSKTRAKSETEEPTKTLAEALEKEK